MLCLSQRASVVFDMFVRIKKFCDFCVECKSDADLCAITVRCESMFPFLVDTMLRVCDSDAAHHTHIDSRHRE